MYTVIVKRSFSAAHRLEGHPGRCSKLHGHTWEVEAQFAGEALPASGMLVDFEAAGSTLEQVVSFLDHTCLNDLEPFTATPPTAENVARHVFERLERTLESAPFEGAALSSVTVWESRDSGAVFAK